MSNDKSAAMTDHKAEWVLVPRVPTPEMIGAFRADAGSATMLTHTSLHCADFDSRYSAMIAAAPAASEGEDGAVATVCLSGERYGHGHFVEVQLQIERGTELPIGTKLYTRPAAQVAATPKHDEGRSPADSLRALANVIRNHGIVAPAALEHVADRLDALATPPAARRVTDDPRVAELIAVLRDRIFKREPHRGCLMLDIEDVLAIRAAIQSFAQPAEGVSGGA